MAAGPRPVGVRKPRGRNDIVTPLSADERAILAVFADAAEPLDWWDVIASLLPAEPPGGWGDTRSPEYRAWNALRDARTKVTMGLYKAGRLVELPDGPVDMSVITDAGREALAADNREDQP